MGYKKGVTRSQHKFHKSSSSGRHEARKSSGFRKSSRNVSKKPKRSSFKKHNKRHRRSAESIHIVVDATRQGVQDLGAFAQNQIQIIGDDLQLLEQEIVRIFTDMTDAKLENTANLFLAFSNFLDDDEVPESSEQESDDLIEGEDPESEAEGEDSEREAEDPEREALKLKKFVTKKKIAQAITKKIIARVKKIINKFKKIKGKRSVDTINSVIDATRQGVQDFGGSAESVDAKFNFISDDDVIPEVSDNGSEEMPEFEV